MISDQSSYLRGRDWRGRDVRLRQSAGRRGRRTAAARPNRNLDPESAVTAPLRVGSHGHGQRAVVARTKSESGYRQLVYNRMIINITYFFT